MNSGDFHPHGPHARIFDLGRGFDDILLSDEGELEISPTNHHDIYLLLGGAVLSLSRIAMPGTAHDESAVKNAYIIRNREEADSSLLLDDGLSLVEGRLGDVEKIHQDVTLAIGREGTPSLNLPNTVSRRHAQLRLGALARNIHLRDLDSLSGTLVALHPYDQAAVNTPRKQYLRTPFGLEPQVWHDGRWKRSR